MGAIKRNITDISNLKRGAAQVVKVYRGANLVWTNAPAPANVIDTFGLGNSVFISGETTLETFKLGNSVFI